MTEEFDRARLVRVIEQGKQTVERIAVALGYRSSTLADMAFTEAELGQLTQVLKDVGSEVRYWVATREDGSTVRAVIRPTWRGDYTADIFSPAFYEGHGSNNDFNEGELEGTLKTALTSPAYVSPKA